MRKTTNPASRRWSLSKEALERLLEHLGPDPHQAGRHYQQIHRKLIRLFSWRGALDPEELADETITRVARRVDQGMEIRAKDPYRYFCGVANLVFKEVLREREKELSALRQVSQMSPLSTGPEVDANQQASDRLPCLRACLRHLSPANRKLVLEYHGTDGSARIRHRQRLAAKLKIPVNALRLRAFRLRSRLETCVGKCVRGETESSKTTLKGQRRSTRPHAWKRE